MERDDARGHEATDGLEREREQRGGDRGGEETGTSREAEDSRREDVERHQRNEPNDFTERGRDEGGRDGGVETP
jgi:hypothetical protein